MILKKNKYDTFLVIIILVTTFFSRYAVSIEKDVFFWSDSAHYALAIQDYSLENDRPHLPGYYLHVHFAKLLNLIFQNEHLTLLIIAGIYSALSAGFFYGICRNWLRKKEAFLLTLVLITNPYFWFFGSVPEIYTFDLFFSTAIVFFGLKGKWIYIIPLLYPLFMAFRPSSGILLIPLYIYLWYSFSRRNNINYYYLFSTHIIGLFLFCIWFILMTNNVGGIIEYFELYKLKGGLPPVTILQNISALIGYGGYLIIPVIIALLFKIKNSDNFLLDTSSKSEVVKLIIAWIAFPFFFFLTYHIAKGYLLILAGAVILSLTLIMNNIKFKTSLLLVIILFQTTFFLFFPSLKIDTEIYFNKSSRTQSKSVIALNRFGTTMLMASSHIRERENFNYEFDNGYRCIKSNNSLRNKKIILEPSCHIILRELQPRYKYIALYSLVTYSKIDYLKSYGLEQKELEVRKDIIVNAIMVGNIQFVNEYLGLNIRKIVEYDNLIFYTIDESLLDDYLNKLDYYFYKESYK